MPLVVAFEPDLGRAATFDDEIDFLVHVLFGIERTCARNLDDVGTPFAFGAVQLDVSAAAAGALPRLQWQVLHFAHADVAVDRNLFRFHEEVVGRLRAIEFAEPGALESGWFVPMSLTVNFVHGAHPLCGGPRGCAALRRYDTVPQPLARFSVA